MVAFCVAGAPEGITSPLASAPPETRPGALSNRPLRGLLNPCVPSSRSCSSASRWPPRRPGRSRHSQAQRPGRSEVAGGWRSEVSAVQQRCSFLGACPLRTLRTSAPTAIAVRSTSQHRWRDASLHVHRGQPLRVPRRSSSLPRCSQCARSWSRMVECARCGRTPTTCVLVSRSTWCGLTAWMVRSCGSRPRCGRRFASCSPEPTAPPAGSPDRGDSAPAAAAILHL